MNTKSSAEVQLEQELVEWIEQDSLYQVILSSPKSKNEELTAKKIIVRPVQLKQGLYYQFESYYANKVLHENVSPQIQQKNLCNL